MTRAKSSSTAAVEPANPRHAQALGISIIYQTFSQAPHLSVAENLYLGREPLTPWGTIDGRRAKAMSRDALARVGLALDPDTPIKRLSVAQRLERREGRAQGRGDSGPGRHRQELHDPKIQELLNQ
jgi:ABC-type uncharacterized transport system ATPase subunit